MKLEPRCSSRPCSSNQLAASDKADISIIGTKVRLDMSSLHWSMSVAGSPQGGLGVDPGRGGARRRYAPHSGLIFGDKAFHE